MNGNISKHFALIKDILFGSSLGLPRPDTLCVRRVSSSNSLTDSLAAKFILEQLIITICITSASGIKFALSISTSQGGSTNEVVASGAWIGAEVGDIPTWGDPVAAIGAWSDIEVVVLGTWTDVEAVDVKLWSDDVTTDDLDVVDGEDVGTDDIGISSAEPLVLFEPTAKMFKRFLISVTVPCNSNIFFFKSSYFQS